jgi:hypothetical protein
MNKMSHIMFVEGNDFNGLYFDSDLVMQDLECHPSGLLNAIEVEHETIFIDEELYTITNDELPKSLDELYSILDDKNIKFS